MVCSTRPLDPNLKISAESGQFPKMNSAPASVNDNNCVKKPAKNEKILDMEMPVNGISIFLKTNTAKINWMRMPVMTSFQLMFFLCLLKRKAIPTSIINPKKPLAISI